MTTPESTRYRNLAATFTALVEEVPANRWSSPSPCEGWTARDVLHHVVETEVQFLDRMEFARPPLDLDVDPDRLRTVWPIVRDVVQAVLDDPTRADHSFDGFFGPTTVAATIDGFYSADLLVHRWDLARAVGLTRYESLEPDFVAHYSVALGSYGDAARMPGIFGPEVRVAADASAQDRLLAYTGRTS